MTYIEPTLWAQKQFGQAHLNDPMKWSSKTGHGFMREPELSF